MPDDPVRTFLDARNLGGVLAITGGAADADTENEALTAIVRELVAGIAGRGIAVSTNGTKWGVPRFTMQEARAAGIPIIRIYPEKVLARGYLVSEPADLELSVPPRIRDSEWGDDTETFIKTADAVVFIKGGTGTQIEFAHWAKINEGRLAHAEKPIYGVPVAGLGGWSAWVYDHGLPLYEKIRDCFPATALRTGREAIAYLCERLGW